MAGHGEARASAPTPPPPAGPARTDGTPADDRPLLPRDAGDRTAPPGGTDDRSAPPRPGDDRSGGRKEADRPGGDRARGARSGGERPGTTTPPHDGTGDRGPGAGRTGGGRPGDRVADDGGADDRGTADSGTGDHRTEDSATSGRAPGDPGTGDRGKCTRPAPGQGSAADRRAVPRALDVSWTFSLTREPGSDALAARMSRAALETLGAAEGCGRHVSRAVELACGYVMQHGFARRYRVTLGLEGPRCAVSVTDYGYDRSAAPHDGRPGRHRATPSPELTVLCRELSERMDGVQVHHALDGAVLVRFRAHLPPSPPPHQWIPSERGG